jgi:hypothetical protein
VQPEVTLTGSQGAHFPMQDPAVPMGRLSPDKATNCPKATHQDWTLVSHLQDGAPGFDQHPEGLDSPLFCHLFPHRSKSPPSKGLLVFSWGPPHCECLGWCGAMGYTRVLGIVQQALRKKQPKAVSQPG